MLSGNISAAVFSAADETPNVNCNISRGLIERETGN